VRFDGESHPCARLQEVRSIVCRNTQDNSEMPATPEAQGPDGSGTCPSGEEKDGSCYTCPTGKSHAQNALAQRVRAHARTHAHLLDSNHCVFKSHERKHHARTNTCVCARAQTHTRTHIRAQTSKYTYKATYKDTHRRAHIRTHKHVCPRARANTHTHTHTHTHTCTQSRHGFGRFPRVVQVLMRRQNEHSLPETRPGNLAAQLSNLFRSAHAHGMNVMF